MTAKEKLGYAYKYYRRAYAKWDSLRIMGQDTHKADRLVVFWIKRMQSVYRKNKMFGGLTRIEEEK